MAISMVREPSAEPNITNVDDIIGLRYAYGNQNGFIIGKGNEISYTLNGSTLTINSGRMVLNGVECDIDANGVAITIDNVATKRYYTVYLQVNLNTNSASILSSYATGDYPTISAGDDLTANPTGTARMELYHFTAQNGVISNVAKLVTSIKYTAQVVVDESVNATECVKKSYFSSSSASTFGGYTVRKEILRWSGNQDFTTSNARVTIWTDPSNNISGRTFRIVYSISPNQEGSLLSAIVKVTSTSTNPRECLSYANFDLTYKLYITKLGVYCSGKNLIIGCNSYLVGSLTSVTTTDPYLRIREVYELV